MKDLYEPKLIDRAEINGHHVWHYLMETTVGDYHLVEHECPTWEIIDDYMGRDADKALTAFKKASRKVLSGK